MLVEARAEYGLSSGTMRQMIKNERWYLDKH